MEVQRALRRGKTAEDFQCSVCAGKLINVNGHFYCVNCRRYVKPACPVCDDGFAAMGCDPDITTTPLIGFLALDIYRFVR